MSQRSSCCVSRKDYICRTIHKRAKFFPLTEESQFLKHLELDVAILYLVPLLKNIAANAGNQRVRLRQREKKMLRKKNSVFGTSWYLQNEKNL